MSLPRLPPRITGYRADEINALLEYAQAITPRNSIDVIHDFSPSGTTPRLARPVQSVPVALNCSFWITQTGPLLFQVAEGWAYISGVDTTIGSLTFDTDVDLTGYITAHKSYAYIAINLLTSAATFGVAGTKPANSDTVENYILAVFTLNDADTAITGIKRTWFQDIHYVSKPE